MSKEPTLERVKKKFEARTSEIKEEYERKKRELETRRLNNTKGKEMLALLRLKSSFAKAFSSLSNRSWEKKTTIGSVSGL